MSSRQARPLLTRISVLEPPTAFDHRVRQAVDPARNVSALSHVGTQVVGAAAGPSISKVEKNGKQEQEWNGKQGSSVRSTYMSSLSNGPFAPPACQAKARRRGHLQHRCQNAFESFQRHINDE